MYFKPAESSQSNVLNTNLKLSSVYYQIEEGRFIANKTFVATQLSLFLSGFI